MYKLCVADLEWLYDETLHGQNAETGKPVHLTALQRARRAAQLLMRRHNVKRAEVVPYLMIGDSLVIRR